MEGRKERKSDASTQVSSGTVILHLCLLITFCVTFTVIRGIYLGPRSISLSQLKLFVKCSWIPHILKRRVTASKNVVCTPESARIIFFNSTGYDVLRSSFANTERRIYSSGWRDPCV